jgi:hypothetical protein
MIMEDISYQSWMIDSSIHCLVLEKNRLIRQSLLRIDVLRLDSIATIDVGIQKFRIVSQSIIYLITLSRP